MNFCGKCGRELQPGEVCNCQETQANDAPQMTAPSQTPNAALQTPANNNKNMMIIAGIAAAILLVVVIAVVALVSGGGNYKTPINKLVKLINSQSKDVFAYQEVLSTPMEYKFTRDAYNILKKSEDTKEDFNDLKEDLKDFYDDLKGFKITKVDFVSADEMKSKDLRSIQDNYDNDFIELFLDKLEDMDKADYEDLADTLDISVSDTKKFVKAMIECFKSCKKVKISKGYEVTMRFYGKYEGETDKTEKIKDIRVLKINGKWFIYDGSKLFSGMSFTDDLSDVDLRSLYGYVSSFDFSSLLY